MPLSLKSAGEELLAYGYTLNEHGMFWKAADTEAWRPELDEDGEGVGWSCFRAATGVAAFPAAGVDDPSGGAHWGRPILAGWLQVPYGLNERFASTSGLHPATHPECFEWLWPDQVVAERYYVSRETIAGRSFRRVELEDGSFDIEEADD